MLDRDWLLFSVYEKLDPAHSRVVLRDTFRQSALGAGCVVVAEYTLRLEPYELSRPFVVLFAIYAWILLCLFRINAARVIGAVLRRFGTAHFVMVVGSNQSAHHIGQALEKSRDYGVRLIGFVDDEPGQVELSLTDERYPLSRLRELLRQHTIEEIIFAVDSDRLARMEDVFLLCDEEGVRTRLVIDFFQARQQSDLSGPVRRHPPAHFLGRASRRTPAAPEARHGRLTRGSRTGIVIAFHVSYRIADSADVARSSDLPSGTLQT